MTFFSLRNDREERVCVCERERAGERRKDTIRRWTHSLCCDDVFLLAFIESSDAFDGHVIRLSSTACKNDFPWIGTNQLAYLLQTIPFHSFIGRQRTNTYVLNSIHLFVEACHRHKRSWERTFLACSTASSLSHPYACVREWGLP